MLRSYLCDCSDAYILVKGRRNATGTNDANRRNKKLTFKNNAPFTLFITKVSSIFIENAGDFDTVMSMFNLSGCSDNCSMTSASFRNYYRDKVMMM